MSNIDYEKIPRYKYRLLSGVVVRLSSSKFLGVSIRCPFLLLDEGKLCFRTGYAWDGCTYFPDFKKLRKAALVHDGLCQLINLGLLPKKLQPFADREFRRIAIEDGFNPWMADVAYRGIRVYQTIKGKGGSAK